MGNGYFIKPSLGTCVAYNMTSNKMHGTAKNRICFSFLLDHPEVVRLLEGIATDLRSGCLNSLLLTQGRKRN